MPARSASPASDITRLGRRGAPRSARPLVPDHLRSSATSRALDNVALAVQAQAGHSFRFWRPAPRRARLREPARAILARGRARRDRADLPAASAGARREARARNRDGAGDASRACCCSTSRWPAWGRRKSARWCELLRAAQGPADDPAGRARHGRGVRARRPHLGAGLRPGHRHRRAGGDPRRPRRCAAAYLGDGETRDARGRRP